jgi:hypothetical protein
MFRFNALHLFFLAHLNAVCYFFCQYKLEDQMGKVSKMFFIIGLGSFLVLSGCGTSHDEKKPTVAKDQNKASSPAETETVEKAESVASVFVRLNDAEIKLYKLGYSMAPSDVTEANGEVIYKWTTVPEITSAQVEAKEAVITYLIEVKRAIPAVADTTYKGQLIAKARLVRKELEAIKLIESLPVQGGVL